MVHGSFNLSVLAAGVAALALAAPVSSAQAQAPNTQTHQHGAAGSTTHRAAAPATHAAHNAVTHRSAERTVNSSRETVTNRRVVTNGRFGATRGGATVAGGVVGGGYVSPSYSGANYGGGYSAGGNHSCWWYRHNGPGNIPRWCTTSYGYAAPASGYAHGYSAPSYSYGYTSGPSRFGTTTRVNRQFASNSRTDVTDRTNRTVNRKANLTAGTRARSGSQVVQHGGAKVAGLPGHPTRQKVTH